MHIAVITAEITASLFLLILLGSMLHGEKKSRASVTFILCLSLAILGMVTDILSYVLESAAVNPMALIIINMLSFFGFDFELAAFAYYIWALIAEKENVSPGFSRFIIVACVLDLAFVLFGTVTGGLFRIENGEFTTGVLYNFAGVFGFIILVCLFVFAFGKRKTAGAKPAAMVVIFFLLTYAAMMVTLTTGADSFMYVGMALAMMLSYISLQFGEIEKGRLRERVVLEMSNTDVLTGLNNRRAFEKALEGTTEGTGAIFCDVNGLKITNDTQGHAAGDALLQRFTELMKKHFSPADLFRISGDEFVVLRKGIGEDAFFAEVASLRKDIAAQNDIASVGCAMGNDFSPAFTLPELVSRAEKDMYTDKKAYYERSGRERRGR